MKGKVGVVILTHNRLSLLKVTLCKVLAQTYKPAEILVVDNNSDDGTKNFLADLNDVTKLLLNDNSGPAGGFYEGIKYFAENTDVDYVWLMDDDFFPFPSCLQILLDNTHNEKVVYPYVREKNLATRLKPGWWGVLVPLHVVKKVGYPKRELFFWAEDSEYLQTRMHKFNFSSEWIPSAKGVHFTARTTNHRKPWKYYYEVRNMLYMRLYEKEPTIRRYKKMLRSWFYLLGAILFKDDDKLKKLKFFILGTYHGVSRKLGKRIEPGTGKRLKIIN
ncbi:glycosyltransferase family 2 protein [Salinimicrobium sp. TH3]|uniref:glycosyltransferase family 2 protein n=1 Tax=Salinimicrobium sp. TH3 TaxID=2997342 RepID=UPI00227444A7|nr:glycosyltransferase family 2 protein [Salinimicrobium sp. TH3]MCY2686969.1 glycosyltransferase family 2 protein [Salinimicrobium sp. TH3]